MKKSPFILGLSALILQFTISCGTTALVSTPIENIDQTPLKNADLTEEEAKNWSHADLTRDTIPGMSVDRAYTDLIRNNKPKTVVVAVLDSGMDLSHEDLDGVLWTNKGEKPGNGKDDDNNGYIDDIHGYDFLGDSYNEQLEYTRMLRLNIGDATTREKARALLEKEKSETQAQKQQYEQILAAVKEADAAVKKHLNKEDYTKKDITSIETEDPVLQRHVAVLTQMYAYDDSIPGIMKQLEDGLTYYSERLNYNLNETFEGRSVVGDDPYNLNDLGYGDGNPKNVVKDESHGTHVAGIIAAERDNGIGIKGIANNVEIMSVRAVPNGDEYDKDIALGIRYAVDNGAKIINASFGKSFSPNAEWVYDALKYAADHDVLFVHAAGNDGNDLDDPNNPNFPNDQVNNGPEIADNVITVGSLNNKYGSEVVSGFSNYGKINVDVFAPGGRIYSTMPGNEYEFQGGTSMAAPAVSGVAALIRGMYPQLSAAQVKHIIMDSGLQINTPVMLAGDPSKSKSFKEISVSGKMVNAYNALILASKVAAGDIKL